jgi:hypothetical protein
MTAMKPSRATIGPPFFCQIGSVAPDTPAGSSTIAGEAPPTLILSSRESDAGSATSTA